MNSLGMAEQTDGGKISWDRVGGVMRVRAEVCIGGRRGAGESIGDIEEAFLSACSNAQGQTPTTACGTVSATEIAG